MAQILSHAGIKEMDILGGEPTLHPGIEAIIGIACAHGFKVSLSSNGSHILIVKKIMDTFGDACALGISLNNHGMTQDLDEFLSEYKPTVKSLCRDTRGLEPHVRTVLAKGMTKFYLIYPDIISGNVDDSLPFHEFFAFVDAMRKTEPTLEPVYCSGFLPDSATYPELSYTRCSAGVTKLGITPDGSVFPCNLFFGMEEFSLGNVFSDKFFDIWRSPKLDFFRRFDGNHCPSKNCFLHKECHGGCPAHSLKFYGELGAPDPRCLTPIL
jgi:radical SAM protein with 4Fe4S-binding SPASM domain